MREQMQEDPRELTRQGDLNHLQDYFNDPNRKSWTVKELENLTRLYEIGQHFDIEDPVNWIVTFDRSYPHSLEIGTSKTRLGKILYAAEIYLENREKSKSQGRRQSKREID